LPIWTHISAPVADPVRALALHCMMARGRAWDGVARALGDAVALSAPDLPGHGDTPWRGGDYLSESLAVAEPELTSGTHLIGHSFGGVLALHLAARHPDEVATLTLIEPVLFAAATGHWRAAHDAAFAPALAAASVGRTEEAARAFHAIWGHGAWAALPERVRADMAAKMPIIAAQQEVLTGPCALDPLDAVRAPTLLVEGTESPAVVGEIIDTLAARLPRAGRVGIDGAGHMAPITHPEAVAAVVAPHLGL